MTKDKIKFEEFLEIEKKLEIRIGRIDSCVRIPKSKKLLEMKVFFGADATTGDLHFKSVVTNLGDKIEPFQLEGLRMPFIMNLEPTTMMGVTSECMIMVGEALNGGIELKDYTSGSKLL